MKAAVCYSTTVSFCVENVKYDTLRLSLPRDVGTVSTLLPSSSKSMATDLAFI